MKRVILASTITKPHVIDLCCVNESDMVINASPLEYLEYTDSWESYYEELLDGSLDDVWFDLEDIDQNLFIIDDGGEMIRLKDGTLVNVCFRGDSCHVWEEDDDERIEYIDYLLKTYG